ncbi:hydroxyethylthiazole kinase [Salinisphaera orenii]|uniref:hydroxyethylthiazole kinase n=1 Tax=Salinisphaera orenii TaxID=856731 RepID=UPI000DBE22E5
MVDDTPGRAGELLGRVRESAPLVQNITNDVAMTFVANTVLAGGGSPAMIAAPEEAGEFARLAGALTVNIGTLSASSLEGMGLAAHAANRAGTPWVLDPVAHFATAFRRGAITDLLALRPTVIRGNASEIRALAGEASAGRGVDSAEATDTAEDAARLLGRSKQAVVAVTGAHDFVTDGERALRLDGGSPLMARVTAAGCALTGLTGAFAAVARDTPFDAVVAALAAFGVAGERADGSAHGPGSFVPAFLDALGALDAETLAADARIVTA